MKVYIDTKSLSGPSRFRGIGKYTSELTTALKKEKGVEIGENDKSFNPDIIHYPYFVFYFLSLPIIKKRKTVVTIHDCTPLVFLQEYPPGVKGKLKFFLQRFSLKSAKAVITDSQSSKNDICRLLGVPKEKIHVVYLAAGEEYQKLKEKDKRLSQIKRKFNLPDKYILYVGDVNYNKNLFGLIEAFSLVKSQDLQLVMVGKAFENEELGEVKKIKDKVAELNLQNRIKFLGFVSDEDLLVIYNLAQAYCQPSFYEGFGIQILEAMACGVPVITGNTSSMPEVAGEAAVLIDPQKPGEIAGAIEKITTDLAFRGNLIGKGLSQTAGFSWEKTARQTKKVYEDVLK